MTRKPGISLGTKNMKSFLFSLCLGLQACAQTPVTYQVPLATNAAYPQGGTETVTVTPNPPTTNIPPVVTPPVTNAPPVVTTPPTTNSLPVVTVPPAGPTIPAQAVAAGFKSAVFDDEFTSNTVAPSTSASSGYNWYPYASGVASTVSNGIMTITASPNGYNEDLQTVPPSANGSTRTGTWQHGYFEARIQYTHAKPASSGTGWPSFWGWAVQALSPKVGQYTAEDDFMEFFPTQGGLYNTLHNWANTASSATGSDSHNNNGTNLQVTPAQPTDDGWHIYGCLWKSTGTGTGSISFYFDNQLVTHQNGTTTYATGTGSGFTAIENDNLMMILGTATGWPMSVDWVRVWQ
jgi:hypothetical protein